jgi:hypothetical protein
MEHKTPRRAPKSFKPQKRLRSITAEKVALINLVQGMNAKSEWWAQTLAMLSHPISSEMTRRLFGSPLAKVNLSGIGRCPECGEFFPKLRKDQKCCLKPKGCAKAYRVRKWREKWREKYYPESGKLYKVAKVKHAKGTAQRGR